MSARKIRSGSFLKSTCLGHQSWANHIGKLLLVYPQFDETPEIKNPQVYVWPNEDNLYCRSYCPLHPDLHRIIFDVVDELNDVFESNAFHAGMDEVFLYWQSKNVPDAEDVILQSYSQVK